MTNSENTNLVLRRCKIMNCLYEGQSFSLSIMDSELGGRATTEATMKTMTAALLLVPGVHGTYKLTRSGAQAVSDVGGRENPSRARAGAWKARRPEPRPSPASQQRPPE